MSVMTAADRALALVKEHLLEATRNLDKFIDPETHGSSDYNTSFIQRCIDINAQLKTTLLSITQR